MFSLEKNAKKTGFIDFLVNKTNHIRTLSLIFYAFLTSVNKKTTKDADYLWSVHLSYPK
ncbi:hypothetical protein AX25_11575 [Listeria ivanovii WSLC3009]|nr:hypothetical protein AX25_11575 [Listeria ivanovii WSLC3009]